MRQDVDKYGKVTGCKARRCTATILFAGNRGYFDAKTRISALQRRLVMFNTEPFFRNVGDPDYDVGNPNCRPKIHGLEEALLSQPNHIFTWFVNCAHKYINNKIDLHATQPQRFKDYCNAIINENNDKHDKMDDKKQEILLDFLNEGCRNIKYCMPLGDFINEFYKYADDNCENKIIFSQIELMKFFKNKKFGDPIIKTQLLTHEAIQKMSDEEKTNEDQCTSGTIGRKRVIVNIKPLTYRKSN